MIEDMLDGLDRLASLDDAKRTFGESEDGLIVRFLNSIGQHEAQDRAFIAHQHVESYLCEHPFIIMDEESWRLANIANQCLAELYQRIGRVNIK